MADQITDQITAVTRSTPEQRHAQRKELHGAPQLRQSVTIMRPVQECFDFWRNFANLPLFMKDISSVTVTSPLTSHWIVELPRAPEAINKIEWDAEIIAERAGEFISWQTIGDNPVKQAGSAWFHQAPGDRGTVVSLSLSYSLPGGKFIELSTKLLGEDPKALVFVNLKRFKAYMETGEIATIDGQTSGRDEDYRHSETH